MKTRLGVSLGMTIFWLYLGHMTKSHCSAMSFDVIMLRTMRVTSLGTCEYPTASDVTSTYRVIADSGVQAFYVTSGNGWSRMGPVAQISSVEDELRIVDYTTRCIGTTSSSDDDCTDKLTYDECVDHVVESGGENVCTWQG